MSFTNVTMFLIQVSLVSFVQELPGRKECSLTTGPVALVHLPVVTVVMEVTAIVPLAATILVVELVRGRSTTRAEARLRVVVTDGISIEIPVVYIILLMLIVAAVPVVWLVAAVIVGGTALLERLTEVATHAV